LNYKPNKKEKNETKEYYEDFYKLEKNYLSN
jgi:hypothetical protein